MRDTAVLVFVTASLADVLAEVSPVAAHGGRTQKKASNVTNRFDYRRLCKYCRLKIERT